MEKHFVMGLKPLVCRIYFTNPFTEVNGNKINYFLILLPSALADGIFKLLLLWALATFLILFIKYLFQSI